MGKIDGKSTVTTCNDNTNNNNNNNNNKCIYLIKVQF
jgi:hypothetical protein